MTENTEDKGYKVPEKWVKDTPRDDHRVVSRALENPLRRKIMRFIGLNSKKKLEEIGEKFDLTDSEVKTHLNYLLNAEIVKKTDEEAEIYQLDEIGKKYLENVEKV